MNKKLLENYARLIVRSGLDLQKDQYLIIEAPIEVAHFVHIVTKKAFEYGAKDVFVRYIDNNLDRIRTDYIEDEELGNVKQWQKDSLSYYLDQGAASLLMKSPNPFLMQGVEASKGSALQSFSNDLRNVIRSKIASDGIQWCIAAVPNLNWAKAIMPDEDESVVLEKFWDLIFKLTYVDEENDPVENWAAKQEKKRQIRAVLDSYELDSLHMTSSNGTDITFGIVESANFGSGIKIEPGKPNYCANIPTEEICTSPDKFRTNGIVYSTKPLMLGGQIVENFSLRFVDGKCVEVKAEKGEQLLKDIVNKDEGSAYIGEVAFVPYHSPISMSKIVYYETLIDENASCHIALGKGFPGCVDAHPTDLKDWERLHLNFSKIHIDFMVGAFDTRIEGTSRNGDKYLIFENGDYALRKL